MDNRAKAAQLAVALLVAEKEMREKFREIGELEQSDQDSIRQATYAEIVKAWLDAEQPGPTK